MTGAKREKCSYALFLIAQDTGRILIDVKDIPEHVVQQIALFIGKAMPMAMAARAGVDALRSLQALGDQINGAMASLTPAKPVRRRARR